MKEFFPFTNKVAYSPDSSHDLVYRFYDANRIVLGKSMKDHLRISVCVWHTFCGGGQDIFGDPSCERPWKRSPVNFEESMEKIDAAVEFASKLDVPFLSFHDTDITSVRNQESLKLFFKDFAQSMEYMGKKLRDNDLGILLGTSNLYQDPIFSNGAATNPDPDVFRYAASKVKFAMDQFNLYDCQNYVLWGGRDGYETLLNTSIERELDQLGRFVSMVVDHKHKIGFKGNILIEPKPCEPTKYQYDFNTATVYGFLKKYGLENEVKMNLEANHATLSGNTFEHEFVFAQTLGLMGSIDANRGDPQNGWDTDQFPNSVEELSLIVARLIEGGGFDKGGFNFDAKIRRQSIDVEDLVFGHIGAIDTLAKSLLVAEKMVKDRFLHGIIDQRYGGWKKPENRKILGGMSSLDEIFNDYLVMDIRPKNTSGRQELLENKVNRYIHC